MVWSPPNFEQFANTIVYDDRAQLVPLLREALAAPPRALTPAEQHALSWEAATQRLIANVARDGEWHRFVNTQHPDTEETALAHACICAAEEVVAMLDAGREGSRQSIQRYPPNIEKDSAQVSAPLCGRTSTNCRSLRSWADDRPGTALSLAQDALLQFFSAHNPARADADQVATTQ